MRRFFVALVAMLTFATAASANTANFDILLPEPPAMSVPADIQLANHYGSGVMERTFTNQGRCSQVCPIMREIGSGHCSSIGRCWCDERGSTTTAYLICN